MTTWLKHVEDWKDCQRCPLSKQRSNICLARGDLPCDVLMIGEAPGMSEDALAQPFVGPAGELLDQIIERALSEFQPKLTYAMTNLVACFPREAKTRGDNEPERGEILECRPRLIEFANTARPRLTVSVGALAEQYITPICTGPHVKIDHPAFILARLPMAQKGFAVSKCIVRVRHAWEDALKLGKVQFRPWRAEDANSKKTKREQLRDTYRSAAANSDIPF